MTQTIFLSTVSSEFGVLRRRLAAFLQRTKRLYVRHQDDFFNHGVGTLQMLEEEVAASSLMIHIIGKESGWCPPLSQVEDFLQRHPEFSSHFPELIDTAKAGRLSATQWEVWLALFHRKTKKREMRVLIFEFPERIALSIAPSSAQQQHSKCLHKNHDHPKPVSSDDALFEDILQSLLGLELLAKQDMHRPIRLPYPSIGTLFKSRDEFISQLRQSLKSSSHRATPITAKVVHGLGGVGKTRLAVEYAWQHAEEYSAVLCVTADSPESLHRNLAALTGPLNLAEHSATEEEVRVAAVLRWLQSHPGWFLILDNVDTEAAAVAVEKLLAELRGGQLLITSRLARFSDAVEALELDVMSRAAGAQFLLEKTHTKGSRGRKPTDNDQADALELATELGGLALAMEQAGAYIVQRRRSFAEYLALWRSRKAAVYEWVNRTMQYAGPSDATLRSVAVTWQTTIEQLSDLERKLLDLLAWFAPSAVPLSIFAWLNESKDQGARKILVQTWWSALKALIFRILGRGRPGSVRGPWDREHFQDAISNLGDFSMLTWDAEAGTVKVHRVVQEILRTRQADPKTTLSVALNLLNNAIPDGDPGDVRTWPAWDPLRPHIAFTASEGKHLEIPVPTSRLMGQLGTLLSAKALHREAETLKRDALAMDEQHFGPDSTEVATRLNNLAQTLQDTNRLAEAEPLMARVVTIFEESYGENHTKVATALNNLAQLLQVTNRLAEAEPLMRRALAIDEQSFGTEHPRVAKLLNNLAQLLKTTNRLAEAEPLMRRALAIEEQSYGAEHPSVARDLNNLAQLLLVTNRLAEAEPLMRRALAIDEQCYGAEHPTVARDLNNLTQLLKATNRRAEAEPLSLRAITILIVFGKATGHEHPNMQTVLANYLSILTGLGLSEDEAKARIQAKLRGHDQ